MLEAGQVSRATVVRVMPYGAMVRLEEGTVGLVHISELADRYVNDVHEFCSEGAHVMVRVLRCKSHDRWEFSMKQVDAPEAEMLAAAESGSEAQLAASASFGAEQPMYDSAMPHQPPSHPKRSAASRAAFDEKLRDFLSDSSERIEDVRRHHDHRLHGKRR